MQLPACVSLLLNTLSGILNLSAFNLHSVTIKYNLTSGGLFDTLGGISIISSIIILLVALIVIVAKFSKHIQF